VLKPRDGLSKGGDTAAAQGWLHESELCRRRKMMMQSRWEQIMNMSTKKSRQDENKPHPSIA
jgi:hypothetical protein